MLFFTVQDFNKSARFLIFAQCFFSQKIKKNILRTPLEQSSEHSHFFLTFLIFTVQILKFFLIFFIFFHFILSIFKSIFSYKLLIFLAFLTITLHFSHLSFHLYPHKNQSYKDSRLCYLKTTKLLFNH